MALKQVRIHGRGGQGAVTTAELIAEAAFIDGKESQAFPFFGVARTGAPVTAFARISDKFVRLREQVRKPDYVIVLDPTLVADVNIAEGVSKDGIILINSRKTKKELGLDTSAKVMCLDVTKISMEVIGAPFVNTAMLGAFAKATGEISLDSLIKAVKGKLSEKVASKNIDAIKRTYGELKL